MESELMNICKYIEQVACIETVIIEQGSTMA